MSGSSSRFAAWQQLLRSANVFTTVSNVLAGWLIVRSEWEPLAPLCLLIAASILLYESGMVLNDAFDAEVDARERPDRPIPSGRISRRTAFAAGWTMLVGGIVAGGAASWLTGRIESFAIVALLAAAVVAYDSHVKKTQHGPIALGVCRTLNVLLGASVVVAAEWSGGAWLYAVAIGVYTVGFSLIAKHEADDDGNVVSTVFRDGEVLCFGAFMAVAAAPLIFAQQLGNHIWLFFLGAPVGWWILSSTRAVVHDPSPLVMRRSVTRLILGFILLDSWISFMAAGPMAGLVVAALFLPAMIASRKVAMT